MFISDAFLNEKRKIGDNEGDKFIKNILESGEIQDLNSIFKGLVYNKEVKTDEIPQYFKDYFDENSAMPDFYDENKINLAQDCFKRFGPSIIVSYFCKSLPECYACGKGAEVLLITGRLTNHTKRRIAQTAQFVLDVMTPGGLAVDGKGLSTAVKVRLIHASIRYYLLQSINNNQVKYDVEVSGYPINQEDLAGTMLAFSVVVIQGLEGLGIKLTIEEKEAILHLWKCVGYLIGIDNDLLPENFEDAELLWEAISKNNFAKTEAGIKLNNDLINLLNELIPLKMLDGIVLLLVNKLIDKKAIEVLEVPSIKKSNLASILSYLFTIGFLNFESEGIFSRFFTDFINLKLMNGLKDYVSEGENVVILVPPGLHKDWTKNNSLFKSNS